MLPDHYITDLEIKSTDQKTLYATFGDGLSSHIYKLNTPISAESDSGGWKALNISVKLEALSLPLKTKTSMCFVLFVMLCQMSLCYLLILTE